MNNMMSVNKLMELNASNKLQPDKQVVKLINGSDIPVLGHVTLNVKKQDTILFLVTVLELPSVLTGLNGLHILFPDWKKNRKSQQEATTTEAEVTFNKEENLSKALDNLTKVIKDKQSTNILKNIQKQRLEESLKRNWDTLRLLTTT